MHRFYTKNRSKIKKSKNLGNQKIGEWLSLFPLTGEPSKICSTQKTATKNVAKGSNEQNQAIMKHI